MRPGSRDRCTAHTRDYQYPRQCHNRTWRAGLCRLHFAMRNGVTLPADQAFWCLRGVGWLLGWWPKCRGCDGQGTVATHCQDPQCGDSTWDHDCGDGSKTCPTCKGTTWVPG